MTPRLCGSPARRILLPRFLPFLLVLLVLALPGAFALVLHLPNKAVKVYHRAAGFGPRPAALNVTARATMLTDNEFLCPPAGGAPAPPGVAGTIVVASRGVCGFYDKVIYAQSLGAVAVVVGNTEQTLIRMGAVGGEDKTTIPSVLIRRSDYAVIKALINGDPVPELTHANPDDSSYSSLSTHSAPARSDTRRRAAAPDVILEVSAVGQVEYADPDWTPFRLAGVMLLVLPVIWCVFTAFYIIRRVCRARMMREQRIDVAKELPVVRFLIDPSVRAEAGQGAGTDAATAASVSQGGAAEGPPTPVLTSVRSPLLAPAPAPLGSSSAPDAAAAVSSSARVGPDGLPVAGSSGSDTDAPIHHLDVHSPSLSAATTSSAASGAAPSAAGSGLQGAVVSMDEIDRALAARRPPAAPSASSSAPVSSASAGGPAESSEPVYRLLEGRLPRFASTTLPPSRDGDCVRVHNDRCSICLDEFVHNQQIKLLPCGHGFHGECIDPWLNRSSHLCPLCKRSILDGLESLRWRNASWTTKIYRVLCLCEPCTRRTVAAPSPSPAHGGGGGGGGARAGAGASSALPRGQAWDADAYYAAGAGGGVGMGGGGAVAGVGGRNSPLLSGGYVGVNGGSGQSSRGYPALS